MQDLLLVAAVAAIFALGWFFVNKWYCFLGDNYRISHSQPESARDILWIGFSNPSVADSIADVLERYSGICSDISVCLFHGSEEELIEKLSTRKLNVIFLPENAGVPADMYYNVREVLLNYAPVIAKYGGLPVEPAANGHFVQNVLWPQETKSLFVRCFIECLEE